MEWDYVFLMRKKHEPPGHDYGRSGHTTSAAGTHQLSQTSLADQGSRPNTLIYQQWLISQDITSCIISVPVQNTPGVSPSSTEESNTKGQNQEIAANASIEENVTEEPESNDTSYGVEATAVRTLAASTGTVAILGTTAKTQLHPRDSLSDGPRQEPAHNAASLSSQNLKAEENREDAHTPAPGKAKEDIGSPAENKLVNNVISDKSEAIASLTAIEFASKPSTEKLETTSIDILEELESQKQSANGASEQSAEKNPVEKFEDTHTQNYNCIAETETTAISREFFQAPAKNGETETDVNPQIVKEAVSDKNGSLGYRGAKCSIEESTEQKASPAQKHREDYKDSEGETLQDIKENTREISLCSTQAEITSPSYNKASFPANDTIIEASGEKLDSYHPARNIQEPESLQDYQTPTVHDSDPVDAEGKPNSPLLAENDAPPHTAENEGFLVVQETTLGKVLNQFESGSPVESVTTPESSQNKECLTESGVVRDSQGNSKTEVETVDEGHAEAEFTTIVETPIHNISEEGRVLAPTRLHAESTLQTENTATEKTVRDSPSEELKTSNSPDKNTAIDKVPEFEDVYPSPDNLENPPDTARTVGESDFLNTAAESGIIIASAEQRELSGSTLEPDQEKFTESAAQFDPTGTITKVDPTAEVETAAEGDFAVGKPEDSPDITASPSGDEASPELNDGGNFIPTVVENFDPTPINKQLTETPLTAITQVVIETEFEAQECPEIVHSTGTGDKMQQQNFSITVELDRPTELITKDRKFDDPQTLPLESKESNRTDSTHSATEEGVKPSENLPKEVFARECSVGQELNEQVTPFVISDGVVRADHNPECEGTENSKDSFNDYSPLADDAKSCETAIKEENRVSASDPTVTEFNPEDEREMGDPSEGFEATKSISSERLRTNSVSADSVSELCNAETDRVADRVEKCEQAPENGDEAKLNTAATTIQASFKGYRTRRHIEREDEPDSARNDRLPDLQRADLTDSVIETVKEQVDDICDEAVKATRSLLHPSTDTLPESSTTKPPSGDTSEITPLSGASINGEEQPATPHKTDDDFEIPEDSLSSLNGNGTFGEQVAIDELPPPDMEALQSSYTEDDADTSLPLPEDAEDQRETAAAKIQAGVRGYLTRKQVQSMKDNTEVVEDQKTNGDILGVKNVCQTTGYEATDAGRAEQTEQLQSILPVPLNGEVAADRNRKDLTEGSDVSEMAKRKRTDDADNEEAAAAIIQSTYRGYKTRQQLKKAKSEAPEEEENHEEKQQEDNFEQNEQIHDRSATIIQAGVRGFLVRKRQKARADAAVKIQAGFRGFKVRRDMNPPK
ncbi:hypothetical protein AAG570_012564 [Ranatra chinensis]|uniref:Abnormal spindle-like microcephaly-associated protein n=1 Tax=Ranatra chinensis TaxID=642074 RepID=A0ABD0YG66_9HEMI